MIKVVAIKVETILFAPLKNRGQLHFLVVVGSYFLAVSAVLQYENKAPAEAQPNNIKKSKSGIPSNTLLTIAVSMLSKF